MVFRLREASLLGKYRYVCNSTCDWFCRKNSITNKVKISKFGTVFMCFSAVNCIAEVKQDGGQCLESKLNICEIFLTSKAQKWKMTITSMQRCTIENHHKDVSRRNKILGERNLLTIVKLFIGVHQFSLINEDIVRSPNSHKGKSMFLSRKFLLLDIVSRTPKAIHLFCSKSLGNISIRHGYIPFL